MAIIGNVSTFDIYQLTEMGNMLRDEGLNEIADKHKGAELLKKLQAKKLEE